MSEYKCITDSKVLFVLIDQTSGLEISNDVVYGLFTKCGKVNKILIFYKQEVTKCLVEMHNTKQATQAIANLNNTTMYGIYCKLTIFPSHFASIDLSRPYTLGATYTQEQYNPTESQQTEQYIHQDNWFKKTVVHYMLDDQSKYDSKCDSISTACSQDYNDLTKNTLRMESSINIPLIYNVFSLFGNITKIVKKNYYTYVMYTQVRFAVYAKKWLRKIWDIPVGYAYKRQVSIRQDEYAECVCYNSEYYRYSEEVESVLTPSCTVKVYYGGGLCELLKRLQGYGTILQYKVMEKNSLEVKYEEISSSLMAIGHLHQTIIGTEHVYLTFAY